MFTWHVTEPESKHGPVTSRWTFCLFPLNNRSMTKPKASKIRRPKTKPKKGTKPPSSDLRHSDDLEEGALQKPLGENPYRRRARTHGRRHGTPGRSGTHRTRTRESMSRGSKGGRNRKSRIRGEMGRSGGWTTSRRRRKKKKKPKGVTKYAWKKVLKERKKRKKKHYSRYRWYWGMISQLEAEVRLWSVADEGKMCSRQTWRASQNHEMELSSFAPKCISNSLD